MEPQQNKIESVIAPLKEVTSVSKYLAMVLFILLPFFGGYVGYQLASEKIVVVESIIPQQEHSNDIITTTNEASSTTTNEASSTIKKALTSFAEDSRYKTDGTNVYLFDDLEPRDDDDAIKQYVLVGADPATFEPFIVRSFPIAQGNTFQAWISRDKNSVFYQDKIIEGADSSSFEISGDVPITKDMDDVFLYYKKIPAADPKTYAVIFNTGAGGPGKVFGRDKNNCYLDYKIMNCAEVPATFGEAVKFSR